MSKTAQSRCRFGIARVDITPPVGMYHRMWGAALHDRNEGIHQPLTATALVFEPVAGGGDAASRQVLVSIDHCVMGAEQVRSIKELAAGQASVQADSIILTFTHTHAAGLLNLDRIDQPGGEFLEDYLAFLSRRIADAVSQAKRNQQPVRITYGSGQCSLAAHRDYFDERSQRWVCGYNPDGQIDHSVLVARITSDQMPLDQESASPSACDSVIATIVNYACHPTSLAWDNRLVSPDFPGTTRSLVENTVGGLCVFLQGASGDVGPVRGYVGDVAIAEKNGRQLGYSVLSALESMPPPGTDFAYQGAVESGAVIGTWSDEPITQDRAQEVEACAFVRLEWPISYRDDLPTREDVKSRLDALMRDEAEATSSGDEDRLANARAIVERAQRALARLNELPTDRFPFLISAWKLGDAVWLAIQGEPYNILQEELRRRFPTTPIVLSTICDAWTASYLPPRDAYGQGIYQESIAVLAPGALEGLIAELSDVVNRLTISKKK